MQDVTQQWGEDISLEQANDWLITHFGAPPENLSQEGQHASHVTHIPSSPKGDEPVLGCVEDPASATTVLQDESTAPPLAHASDSNPPPERNKKTRRKVNNYVEKLRVANEKSEEIQKSNTDLEALAARQDLHICELQQELQEFKDRHTMLQDYISFQEVRVRDLARNLGMAAEDKASLKVALEAATIRIDSLTQNLGSMTSDNAQLKESMRVQNEYIALLEHEAREKEASEVIATKHAEDRITQPTSMTDNQLRAEFPALFSTRLMTYDQGRCQQFIDEEEKITVEACNSLIAIRDEVVYGIRR